MNHQQTKHELLALAEKWSKAMVANDPELIGSFMAEEWVIVSERGISGKEYFLDFVRSGALTHDRFEMVGDARIKVYGDTAVLTARVVNTAFFGTQRFDADEWTSDVFVKNTSGKWLCVLSQITPVIQEQEN